MFSDKKKRSVLNVRNNIMYKAALNGERLVLMHRERFFYPTSKTPTGHWEQMQISRRSTRCFYYHATQACVYGRFRKQYFENTHVRCSAQVLDEWRTNPTDLAHPDLFFWNIIFLNLLRLLAFTIDDNHLF